MAITRVGAGSAASGTGDVTPIYPAAYTAVADDVAVVHLCETVADTGEYTTPAGWTKVGTILNEIGATDGRASVYLKKLTAAEALPTFTGDTVDQVIVFCEIYRGVDTATPQDVAAVTSEANNTTTFTPTGLTTVTNEAWAISSIGIPFNGGDADLSVAQSFTIGSTVFTTTGLNVTSGSAYREVAAFGAVTYPTWNKVTFTGIGQWCSVAFALRPAVVAPPATVEGWVGIGAGQVAAATPTPTAGLGIDDFGDDPFGGS